jgi:FAD/FMN-containing dehydrogenase
MPWTGRVIRDRAARTISATTVVTEDLCPPRVNAMDRLLADLAAIVGSEHILTDPGMTAGYTTDWTRRYSGIARCVVRPGSAAEVAATVQACGRHGAAIVPQGGNTGLVGGGVPWRANPDGPPVVLSTRRLTRLDPVDTLAAQVTAGAGVTIAALREHAAKAGFEYGVKIASRESATVGGTIATNAGGVQTIRYGGTRAQVLGVEAVLADGSAVSRLGGILTDNTGYDLAQLIVGSEGTLGVVTAARLRLWPAEPPALTLLAGVGGVGEAVALQARLRGAVPNIRAVEYFEAAGLALVREHTGLPAPPTGDCPGYLLVEAAGSGKDIDHYAERLALTPGLHAPAVAMDGPAIAMLWAYRERHTEAISAAGIPHKLDVAMPLTRLAAFRAELDEVAARLAARVIVFGHIGAGNLHVNVLGPDPEDETADEEVLRLAAAHGGTISAEHGIGHAKAPLLYLSRTPAEIAAMRAVKAALDPAGILNPGVLLAD